MEKHFELTENYKLNADGVKLFQIRCTRDVKWAKVGDLGGWIESESNLSDNAWVSGDAQVSGDARVSGNAQVSGDAQVYGNDLHCGFDCFGSNNRHTHAYMTKSGEVEITCGCFRGSIPEFEQKVHETHKGTIYERQYMAIIELIKIKFGLK